MPRLPSYTEYRATIGRASVATWYNRRSGYLRQLRKARSNGNDRLERRYRLYLAYLRIERKETVS